MSIKAPTYIIGIDLGKKRDYTALVVLRRTVQFAPYDVAAASYDLIHLDRWRHRDYVSVIFEIDRLMGPIRKEASDWRLNKYGNVPGNWTGPEVSIVVDQTGVGEAVVESLRHAGLECFGITIHGGDKAASQPQGWRVPKRELVGTVEVLLQNRRLKFADGLPMASTLQAELQSFKATIKLSTGHVSYGADEEWREGEHDDTVLALALASWFGENTNPYAWDDFNRWMEANAF